MSLISLGVGVVGPWKDAFAPSTWTNWALVVVGILGTIIAIRTLRSFVEQTRATKVAADAAKKSADVAEMALKLAERADILLTQAALVKGEGSNPANGQVIIGFKNSGRTRAENVRLSLKLLIEGVPETDCSRIPTITIGSGDTQKVCSSRFQEFLTKDDAVAIFAGKRVLRFNAEATYQDIFGSPHKASFSGALDFKTGTFRIGDQQTT